MLTVETTEVLGGLASVATALDKESVGSGGALKSELIEGECTSTSL